MNKFYKLSLIFIPLFSLISCQNAKSDHESIIKSLTFPKIFIGHRGSMVGNAVENTKRAFINGAKAGYHGLETDVQVSKDGVLFCFHDYTLERLTQYSDIQTDIRADSVNFDQIKDIELTQEYNGKIRKGDKICTFDDYLQVCQDYQVMPFVELKPTNGIYSSNSNPNNHNFANLDRVVQRIYDYGLDESTVFISQMMDCLIYIHEHYPSLKLQWVCGKGIESRFEDAINNNIGIDINYYYLTDEIVQKTHQAKLPVNIWTLNDDNLISQFAKMGVDMITTDYLIRNA